VQKTKKDKRKKKHRKGYTVKRYTIRITPRKFIKTREKESIVSKPAGTPSKKTGES